jgi:hypothetical protein
MRCSDLIGTWRELRTWFEARGVLVLPRLTGVAPTACLECDLASDLASDGSASGAELAVALDRLRGVVERSALPVVYVGQVRVGPDGDPASVTVRAVISGIVHELTLVAPWYAAEGIDIDRSLSPTLARP